jgi:hypothetical protein
MRRLRLKLLRHAGRWALLAALIPVAAFLWLKWTGEPVAPAWDQPAAFSPQRSAPTDPLEPLEITIGAYINQLLEINFAEDYFIVDMWLWFRWEEPREGQFRFKGEDNYPLKTFEVTNGRILDRSGEETDGLEYQGRRLVWQNVRVIAQITQRFNMRAYPADSHALEILIEDSGERVEKVRYLPDRDFSRLGANVRLPGWRVSERKPEVLDVRYPTNFGNITLNDGGPYESYYSQFRYVIDLAKPVTTSIIKSLWPTLLATLVAILALFLNPRSDARFELAIGAIFAIVFNKLSITSSVQDAVQFGYSDVVQIISAMVIALTLTESVWAARQAEKGIAYRSTIRKVDFRFAWALFIAYLLLVAALLPIYRGLQSSGQTSPDFTSSPTAVASCFVSNHRP